jgi:hypothetical protein
VSEPCIFCGEPATEGHHCTGRLWGNGPYLDPELKAPSCGPCNKTDFAAWKARGLHRISWPSVARLRRLAFFFNRLLDSEGPITLPRAFVAALVACLILIADDLEADK